MSNNIPIPKLVFAGEIIPGPDANKPAIIMPVGFSEPFKTFPVTPPAKAVILAAPEITPAPLIIPPATVVLPKRRRRRRKK